METFFIYVLRVLLVMAAVVFVYDLVIVIGYYIFGKR